MTVRLLVTGFEPFPGAPVNPTERLVRHFENEPPLADEDVACRFAVLPVDYGQAIPALERVSAVFRPHVAVHFGLAREARGFRLERRARTGIGADIPDNAGNRPGRCEIRAGRGHVPSGLPLNAMEAALRDAGHAVEWSDDAGGYLCNYVFFHSAAGLCRGLETARSGFVHVGPVAMPGKPDGAGLPGFGELVRGAEIVLRASISGL
ncbi:pyroglutamyl-peptidase I [Oricola thermophila]|uniref:Pyrrolidone-carboxylate peptidase n=1 Tax=Oricola thermophila TaxID=2742145 RepID=A0A6N1VHB5_9HYPH|nr:pyroglutamyl-peptidase I [Oricola thermophila]QKV18387.1 pyroglutamyl-peptidase I [Oricola thermophila]